MGNRRWDGSIISANKARTDLKSAKNKVDQNFNLYKCLITKVNFVDNPENTTYNNTQVTYEGIILSGGNREGRVLKNIKSINSLGGEFNFSEHIWRPSIIQVENLVNSNSNYITSHSGDIVYVAFIQGSEKTPIIVGGGVSYKNTTSTGASSIEGLISRKQYNGVYEEINKDGEYKLIRKGGSYDSDALAFTPETEEEAFKAQFLLTDSSIILKNPNSSLTFNQTNQTYTHLVGKSGSDNIYSEVISGNNEKTTRAYKSGLTIVEDGANDKVTITTDSGTQVEINGATGKVTISASLIDLGASISDLVTKFTELASAFNSHTHLYDDNGTTKVTQPPLGPMPSSVGSSSVKVQS